MKLDGRGRQVFTGLLLTLGKDLCKVHNGMVADQAVCPAEPCHSPGILHDRLCGSRTDAFSSITPRKSLPSGGYHHRSRHKLGSNNFWNYHFPLLRKVLPLHPNPQITSILTSIVRYAWVPQAIVYLILAGCAGPKFNTTIQSTGTPSTIAGNRLSFFSVCLSAAITYAPGAADFLVYCSPHRVRSWQVFLATLTGLSLSFSFTFLLGVGLSSGISNDPAWAAAGAGSGALVVAGFDNLGTFGKFCAVVAALGLVANIVPPTYVSGINFQILGRYPALVPRFVWNTCGVIVYAACALAGRDHLATIFTNFLALMGYWVAIWIAITLEEQLIFRRNRIPHYVWEEWNKPGKLPLGVAALTAFLVGWVGAILCMTQVYYVGPIAKLVGDYGADMGNYVGFAWAALVYPPLRWWELRRFGR